MVMAMLKMRAVGDQGVSKGLAGKKGGARSRSCPWASKTRGIQNARAGGENCGVVVEDAENTRPPVRRPDTSAGATQQMWHAI